LLIFNICIICKKSIFGACLIFSQVLPFAYVKLPKTTTHHTNHTKTTTCKPQNTDLLQLGLFTLLFYNHAKIFANPEKVQNIARGGTGLHCRYVRSKANKQRKRHFPECLCWIYTGASYLAPLKTIFYYLLTTTMKNYNKQQLKEIQARAYAHGCQKEWIYIALNWLKREEITAEEKQKAIEELEKMKKENAESYTKGEFWLCPMWWEKEGDFNNHRARACFIAPDGKKWFVEFTTWQTKQMKQEELHLDYLINKTMEEEYNQKLVELQEKNKAEPHRRNRPEEDQNARDKYFAQPYYWERYHEAADFLKWKPATRQTALEMINAIFGANFKSLEICDLIEPERVNKQ